MNRKWRTTMVTAALLLDGWQSTAHAALRKAMRQVRVGPWTTEAEGLIRSLPGLKQVVAKQTQQREVLQDEAGVPVTAPLKGAQCGLRSMIHTQKDLPPGESGPRRAAVCAGYWMSVMCSRRATRSCQDRRNCRLTSRLSRTRRVESGWVWNGSVKGAV